MLICAEDLTFCKFFIVVIIFLMIMIRVALNILDYDDQGGFEAGSEHVEAGQQGEAEETQSGGLA